MRESVKRGWMRSSVVGGIIGVFAGGITVLLLESVGHQLFGTAEPFDISKVTTPMFVSVLIAWTVGSAVAGWVATYWARSTSLVVGGVVGLVLLTGSVGNFFAFPHPVWVMVSALILMPSAALWGASRARREAA